MKNIIIAALLLFLTTSCVETVVVGSLAGVALVTREKTIKDTGEDIAIAAKVDKEFLLNGLKGVTNSVGVTVDEGRVLLTGIIRDPDQGRLALDIVWKIDGVREVIDEVETSDDGLRTHDFTGTFSDSYLTSIIKLKLFLHPKISPTNYKITTFNRVVYLIGVYRSEDDLKEALRLVSTTYGVKKVVNYVISIHDHRRKSS